MGGATETEVKLRVSSPEAAREAVARIGASLARERHFEDNLLFDDPSESLKERGSVLRLRVTPHATVLTFKGPKRITDGVKVREESQVTVGDPKALQAILRSLGLEPVFRYQKYRETWSHRGQEIVIDETPVGTYMEIEGDADGIRAVAAELGHEPSEFLSESYVDLFFAQGGQGDMVFDK